MQYAIFFVCNIKAKAERAVKSDRAIGKGKVKGNRKGNGNGNGKGNGNGNGGKQN